MSCSLLRDFINAARLGMSLLVSWHSSLNSEVDNCFGQEICLQSLEMPVYTSETGSGLGCLKPGHIHCVYYQLLSIDSVPQADEGSEGSPF